jgi:hypothetical protein
LPLGSLGKVRDDHSRDPVYARAVDYASFSLPLSSGGPSRSGSRTELVTLRQDERTGYGTDAAQRRYRGGSGRGIIIADQAAELERIAGERRRNRAFVLRLLGGFGDFFMPSACCRSELGSRTVCASSGLAGHTVAAWLTFGTFAMWGLAEYLTGRLKLVATEPLAAPLISHPLFGTASGAAVTTTNPILLFPLILALALIALIVDRRALLVAGLGYLGAAMTYSISRFSGEVATAILITLLALGLMIIVLGISWRYVRGALMRHLPDFPTGRGARMLGYARGKLTMLGIDKR